MYDVAVIGAGIVGTSAAAYLAEAGAAVVLLEATEVGAGASGRNSGAIQHPIDELFGLLHRESLALYRELAGQDPDFHLGASPDGLLIVTTDEDAARAGTAALREEAADLAPTFVSAAEVRRLEPQIADGVAACMMSTGYAVAPASATLAFARRAVRAGAELRLGERLDLQAARDLAGVVLVAAGPWSVDIVPGWARRPPINRSWGVVAAIDLPKPPRHILEEMTIDITGASDPVAFSLMTAAGATSLGSTFLRQKAAPRADDYVARLIERGRDFVPALARANVVSQRVCARPVSFDGRPLIGPVPGEEGLFVCAGHGPWGISTGPASARMVADAILGRASSEAIPDGLAASRFAYGSGQEPISNQAR